MSASTAYWLVWAVFVAACLWARPKTELRFWVLIAGGVAMIAVGFARGVEHERTSSAHNTPLLTDRNMPR